MCYCDGPQPDIYEATVLKGRKAWRCCECLDDIPVAQRHEHVKGLWEDCWSEFRTCLDCVAMRDESECSCMPHGLMMDHLDERDGPRQAAWLAKRDANYWRLEEERRSTEPTP